MHGCVHRSDSDGPGRAPHRCATLPVRTPGPPKNRSGAETTPWSDTPDAQPIGPSRRSRRARKHTRHHHDVPYHHHRPSPDVPPPMRRLRRRAIADRQQRLYCGTNGCTSFLELDPETGTRSLPHLRVRPPHPLTARAVPGPIADRRTDGAVAGRRAAILRRVTAPTATLDRARLARAAWPPSARRSPREHPRSAALHERGQGLAPRRRADALDGQVGRPVPALRRVGRGRPLPLRRRPRLRRLLPRRHRGDGRPRPGPDDRRRRAPAAPRHHPHAADRGRGLGRRGADPPVRAAGRGSSPCPRPTRTAWSLRLARHITGRSKVVVHDHCYHGSVDEAIAMLDDGRHGVVPVRGSVGPAGRRRRDDAGRRVQRRRRASRRRSPTATSRRCWSSRR